MQPLNALTIAMRGHQGTLQHHELSGSPKCLEQMIARLICIDCQVYSIPGSALGRLDLLEKTTLVSRITQDSCDMSSRMFLNFPHAGLHRGLHCIGLEINQGWRALARPMAITLLSQSGPGPGLPQQISFALEPPALWA